MTNKEQNIIDLLQQIYEEFSSLDTQHDSDLKEFIEALHRLQHLVMIRSVRRKYPELFPMKKKKINLNNINELEQIVEQELNKQFKGEK